MKRTVLIILLFVLFSPAVALSQIITPVIKANFGVEANLKANLFDTSVLNHDDWFPGNIGSGTFIIDTSGASAIMQQYQVDPNYRKNCFIRPMNYPIYSVVNGKFLYDALFIRDHYKNDSTSFPGSNKNGQSPALWAGGTTPVPGKSDLNDVMVHVRRDGSSLSDSLWFFAGLSLHGNTGNRYFDFELYQTDIYYNNADNKFYNVGPHAGHTAWQFDALGNVVSPGDVIFTAEFGSSSLTYLEARIWIDKNSMLITPSQFNWGGVFDGDGSGAQYGYASILPKTGGAFYSGMQSVDSTWAGPFGFVDITDILKVNYDSKDYMEIAVNMTKIGLDPYSILGSSGCNLSFKRFFAKTRSSTSFTSDLKDFVGPYLIARPAAVVAINDTTLFCGSQDDSTTLFVQNPIATSTYTWTTLDGHIVSSSANGSSVVVDSLGTYIVTQTLISGCDPYSVDTITLLRDAMRCQLLATGDMNFTAKSNDGDILLKWTSAEKNVTQFEIEKSIDGRYFNKIGLIKANYNSEADPLYELTDVIESLSSKLFYYRLKMVKTDASYEYSKVLIVQNPDFGKHEFSLLPNPAKNHLQVYSKNNNSEKLSLKLYNNMGHKVLETILINNSETINLDRLQPGIYIAQITTQEGVHKSQKKLLIER